MVPIFELSASRGGISSGEISAYGLSWGIGSLESSLSYGFGMSVPDDLRGGPLWTPVHEGAPICLGTPIQDSGPIVLDTPIYDGPGSSAEGMDAGPLDLRGPTILDTPIHDGPDLSVLRNDDAHEGATGPIREPKVLEAFSKATPVKPTGMVQGGGKPRSRWEDKRYIYEWDSRHGTVEKYAKGSKKHLGEFDPKTGRQIKGPNPRRRAKG